MDLQNPFQLKDPKAQKLCAAWLELETSNKQIEEVGVTFFKNILVVDEITIGKFLAHNQKAIEDIVTRKVFEPDADVVAFWEDVKKIFPDLLSDEDTQFLTTECTQMAAFQFVECIEPVAKEKTEFFRTFNSYAHAYK